MAQAQMRLEAQAAQRQQCQALQQELQTLRGRLAQFHGLPAGLEEARRVCAETSERVNGLGAAFDQQYAEAGY